MLSLALSGLIWMKDSSTLAVAVDADLLSCVLPEMIMDRMNGVFRSVHSCNQLRHQVSEIGMWLNRRRLIQFTGDKANLIDELADTLERPVFSTCDSAVGAAVRFVFEWLPSNGGPDHLQTVFDANSRERQNKSF